MTTHGWGACTSVEGTRAPSMGDAIERTTDSTRLSQEKSSLGRNRVTVYFLIFFAANVHNRARSREEYGDSD
jgi:hypothetical protein